MDSDSDLDRSAGQPMTQQKGKTDFDKMKEKWAANDISDGSELEDSEAEEEYGDKDFEMTPEAVDPVPYNVQK